MKKTHKKSDGTYVDQRAQLVAENYEKHLQERLGALGADGDNNVIAETLDQYEKNKKFLKVGYIFGLGVLRKEIWLEVGSSSSAPQPGEEPEISAQRFQEMETSLKHIREENLEVKQRLEAMEKFVATLANRNA